MNEFYSVRSIPTGFRIVKFDGLWNPVSIYEMRSWHGRVGCSCFASSKPSCRHREMLEIFIAKKAVNTGRFYDWQTAKWLPAIKMELS